MTTRKIQSSGLTSAQGPKFANASDEELAELAKSASSTDCPTASGDDGVEHDFLNAHIKRAWVSNGRGDHEIGIREVAFAGGIGSTTSTFDVGSLVRIRIECHSKKFTICAQIVSCSEGFIAFRLYGNSGKPKTHWESIVTRLRQSDLRRNVAG